MYQTIYENDNGHMYLYDKKRKRLAELNLNIRDATYSSKSHYSVVSLLVALVSTSLIGKLTFSSHLNISMCLLISSAISIISSVLIFILIKKRQEKMLERHQILYSEELVNQLRFENKSTNKKKLFYCAISIVVFCTICVCLLYMTKILLFSIMSSISLFFSFLIFLIIFIPYENFFIGGRKYMD